MTMQMLLVTSVCRSVGCRMQGAAHLLTCRWSPSARRSPPPGRCPGWGAAPARGRGCRGRPWPPWPAAVWPAWCVVTCDWMCVRHCAGTGADWRDHWPMVLLLLLRSGDMWHLWSRRSAGHTPRTPTVIVTTPSREEIAFTIKLHPCIIFIFEI